MTINAVVKKIKFAEFLYTHSDQYAPYLTLFILPAVHINLDRMFGS